MAPPDPRRPAQPARADRVDARPRSCPSRSHLCRLEPPWFAHPSPPPRCSSPSTGCRLPRAPAWPSRPSHLYWFHCSLLSISLLICARACQIDGTCLPLLSIPSPLFIIMQGKQINAAVRFLSWKTHVYL